jgi:DNA-binding NarL/FixJ family response regulator
MIRIAIVDDHPVVREGLAVALDGERDFQITGSAGSAEALIEHVAEWLPDVVILDFEMPGLSGADAVREVLRAAPKARVIVFTAYAEDDRVVGAVRAGAAGYLLKGAPATDVAKAIRDVHAGGSYLPAQIAAIVARQVQEPQREPLSGREREVLRLVADGLSTKQIARRLDIVERTVKYHVNAAMAKLGAENRSQAVALAVRRRLL